MNKFNLITSVITIITIIATITNNYYLSILLMVALSVGIIWPEIIVPIYFFTSLSGVFIALPSLGMGRYLAGVILIGVTLKKIKNNETINFYSMGYLLTTILISIFSTFILKAQYSSGFYVMLFNIFIFFIFSNFLLKRLNINLIIEAIVVCFIVATLLFALKILFDYQSILGGSIRVTILENLNPNRMAMMCSQMSVFLFTYNLIYKNKLSLLSGFINLIIVLFTGSRSAFLGLIVGIVLIYLLYLKINKISVTRFLRFISISLILGISVYFILLTNSYLASRMSLESIIDSGGSGREIIIDALLTKVIPDHFFFGIGLGSENEVAALANYFRNPYPSHNFLISLFTQVGIIGLLAYFSFFVKVLRTGIKNVESQPIYLIPISLIITGFFNGVGEIVFIERWFWNAFALIALIYQNSRNRE